MAITAAITAVEAFLPEYVLNNQELSQMVDTSDEWITSRTGVKERRILKGKEQGASVMGAEAVKRLCAKRGISPEEIDLLIVATVTGDYIFPATANIISDKVGAKNAWSYDINAACSGFIYALTTGAQFIQTGAHKKVVVVGVDKMSSIVDYTDRTTCVIFGDGAGAVLLEPNNDGFGIRDFLHKVDGSGRVHLFQKAGGSVKPPSIESVEKKEHFVYQEGQAVFKVAVKQMADVSYEMMQRNNLKADDVSWLVPHQANKRIIDAVAHRMDLPESKVMLNIHKYGNTTSGTIPICLWEYEKKLKKGDNIILSAFGGGFTWGAIYVKWAYNS
ncbi:MAG TPA: beta-ketoacyl-ACP synthase III [Bacteroidia bacterium]|nr:beta-ketoacyl-ACP synthase III [Bacteroidia bacterium]